jgi:hypothetical protein
MAKKCNSKTSAPVILDSSSGDPKAKSDSGSLAAIGANMQSMKDQAEADTCFDKPEGFQYNMNDNDLLPHCLLLGGALLIFYSFLMKK